MASRCAPTPSISRRTRRRAAQLPAPLAETPMAATPGAPVEATANDAQPARDVSPSDDAPSVERAPSESPAAAAAAQSGSATPTPAAKPPAAARPAPATRDRHAGTAGSGCSPRRQREQAELWRLGGTGRQFCESRERRASRAGPEEAKALTPTSVNLRATASVSGACAWAPSRTRRRRGTRHAPARCRPVGLRRARAVTLCHRRLPGCCIRAGRCRCT